MIEQLKEWCKVWVGYYSIKNDLTYEINNLTQINIDLLDMVTFLQSELQVVTDKYELTKKQLSTLLEDNKLDILSLKDWYAGRRNQTSWIYNGRRLGAQDVSVYLRPDNIIPFTDLAQRLIDDFSLTIKNTPTEVITAMYKYWNKSSSWTYVSDSIQFGQIEWWENASDAIITRKGDCETKAMCMLNTATEMLRLLNMHEHEWRLTFVASVVAGEGGHAYLTWLYNDGEYYVVESTYYEISNFNKTWLKTPMRFNNMYQDPWGFATKTRSWRGTNSALLSFKDF